MKSVNFPKCIKKSCTYSVHLGKCLNTVNLHISYFVLGHPVLDVNIVLVLEQPLRHRFFDLWKLDWASATVIDIVCGHSFHVFVYFLEQSEDGRLVDFQVEVDPCPRYETILCDSGVPDLVMADKNSFLL